jgi:hypothetical protein
MGEGQEEKTEDMNSAQRLKEWEPDGGYRRSIWFHLKRAPARLLKCGLLGVHTKARLYSLNYKAAIVGRGPHGKHFVEYWPCKHCDILYEVRVRKMPGIKIGYR